MLQSPASLAVYHSFICITNWGETWVYVPQNISCMCREIRLDLHFTTLFPTRFTHSLWLHLPDIQQDSCTLIPVEMKHCFEHFLNWSRHLSMSQSHSLFLPSRLFPQLSGIQSYSKPPTSKHGPPHIKSFEHFYCLANFLSNLSDHSPWKRDYAGC